MTNQRVPQLEHVSQLLNSQLRTFHKLIEIAVSDLGAIQSSFRQLLFLYEKLEEETEHTQILKDFRKDSKSPYHH